MPSITRISSFPSFVSFSLYMRLPLTKSKTGRCTLFPASSAFFVKVYAGSTPPITSTTILISGSFKITSKSCTIFSWIGSPGKSRRSSTYLMLISSPAFLLMLLWLVLITSTTPEPTVPYPKTAIWIILSLLLFSFMLISGSFVQRIAFLFSS